MAKTKGFAELEYTMRRVLPRRAFQIAESRFLKWAPAVEAYMHINHPWRNRTEFAERELRATVVDIGGGQLTMRVSHGPQVYYSVYLEYGHQGRFAILRPTMRRFWPTILADVKRNVLYELGGELRPRR